MKSLYPLRFARRIKSENKPEAEVEAKSETKPEETPPRIDSLVSVIGQFHDSEPDVVWDRREDILAMEEAAKANHTVLNVIYFFGEQAETIAATYFPATSRLAPDRWLLVWRVLWRMGDGFAQSPSSGRSPQTRPLLR